MTRAGTTEFGAVGRAADGGTWTPAKDLPVAVNWQSPDENVVLLTDGRALVAGGQDANFASVPTGAVFDPAARAWTTTGPLAQARSGHSITALDDGTALAVGGFPTSRVSPAGLATAERFHPVAGKWEPAGTMSVGRTAHSATRLADGRVLVTGGYADRSGTTGTAASAEIYDPNAETWTPVAPMDDARAAHQAVLLRDGRVLVIGGTATVGGGSYTGLAFCEIYDPVADTWRPTGSMARPRFDNTATVLRDGTVLVTGGGYSGWVAGWVFNAHNDWTTERYNPATGGWTRESDLSCARLFHCAVLLPDGRVLVLGGANAPTGLLTGYRSAELYDPRTRKWQPAAGTATGRWAFGALALGDGRVLVTGGVEHIDWSANNWKLTASTEIYTPPEGEQ
ncbi:Kelch repeat-containing protein [Nocardia suismassiliense]|uniref:Kelch repeat-containing protein n=1 Tax=Nocardia suismassiliense TaxID=2077092 RepID=UPI000D1D6BBC|nr:kelch repeat-containing protein [Nocardia suismassiliense]